MFTGKDTARSDVSRSEDVTHKVFRKAKNQSATKKGSFTCDMHLRVEADNFQHFI